MGNSTDKMSETETKRDTSPSKTGMGSDFDKNKRTD